MCNILTQVKLNLMRFLTLALRNMWLQTFWESKTRDVLISWEKVQISEYLKSNILIGSNTGKIPLSSNVLMSLAISATESPVYLD